MAVRCTTSISLLADIKGIIVSIEKEGEESEVTTVSTGSHQWIV